MSFETPYLEAIQAVLGDTPGEKYQWIAKLIRNRIQAGGEPLEVSSWKEVPQPLVPLFEIEAGKMLKKYDAVTEALKSEDFFIVKKALEARWYFDGCNKEVINVDYFFRNIFPFVSLKTRTRIIKSLSRHLARKEPALAEEFFVALSDTYGVDQTIVHLLNACSESFVYDAIVRHKIILCESMLKTMYRTAPNLVIRYLKLDQPNEDPLVRNLHKVDIYQYTSFLPMLIKKNLDAFIEIFERFEKNPPMVKLSNKYATIFLKNAKEHFHAKPKLFIKILPLKLIDSSRLESIFLKLFPEDIKKFNTDNMLLYLQHYPEDKKASLLLKSYEQVYGKNLLDNIKNVTANLLKILPEEQRIEQARLLLVNKPSSHIYNSEYAVVWRCYLPLKEVIAAIKKDISTAKNKEDRASLIAQMIYACKINHDDDALLEVLEYCDNRHKNEDAYFWSNIMSTLMQIYDIENLNEKHWNVIDEIILRNHVKNYLESYYDSTNRSLIEKALYYRLKNNLPIDKMIEIYVDLERQHWNERWSILRDNPDYELRVFEASLDAVKARFESNNNKWTESKIYIVEDLLAEIYDYNKRHVKLNTRREKLSLKKFPWLMEMVQSIVTDQSKKNMVNDLKYSLKTNEKDLYDAWVMEKEKVADVSSGKAFTRLKKDPKCVLEQWEEYLSNCEHGYYNGNTKRFLLACRWYKDIPIKFANEAVKRFQTENKLSYLQILGTLLYGDTFTKLIEPYIPREKTIDVKSENAMNDYHLLISALEGMLVSNPPISLELVGRLCEGDYLSLALRVITNVCNRTAIPKIRSFANDLTSKRVSVRKHGIRLICAIQTLQESSDFLLSQWKNEDHHSIREVIFLKVYQLFQKQPGPVTWSAFRECISTLKLKDWATVKDQLIPSSSVPTEYIFDLIRLIMRTTDNFVKEGLEQEKAMYYLRNVFVKIDESIANVLPDEFCEEIIEKYLFDPDYVLDNFLREFLVQMYLFLRKDKIDSRVAALSRFFMAAVKSGWNVPHPKKAHFYPVNYTIYTIINDIVSTFLNRKDKDLRIIDGVLNFFTVFLTPENDITSYFLLILAKEYVESSTTVEFALRLGDKIPELIQKHTPLYPSCIIDSLQYFFAMICVDNLEEVKLTVIETLLECSSVYAHLVAVSSLPTINTPANVARYDALVERFRNDNNPAIRSILYMKINGAGFYSCTVNP